MHNSVDNVDNLQKVDNYRALKRGERCLKLFKRYGKDTFRTEGYGGERKIWKTDRIKETLTGAFFNNIH